MAVGEPEQSRREEIARIAGIAKIAEIGETRRQRAVAPLQASAASLAHYHKSVSPAQG